MSKINFLRTVGRGLMGASRNQIGGGVRRAKPVTATVLLRTNQETQFQPCSLIQSRLLHTTRPVNGPISASSELKLDISDDKKFLIVTDDLGQCDRFNAMWLRHSCLCPDCVEPLSGQRHLNPSALQEKYTIESAYFKDGVVYVRWNEEDHLGMYPADYLSQSSYSPEARAASALDTAPQELPKEMPRVKYDDVVSSDEGMWQWLKSINDVGTCIVEGIPLDKTVMDLASLIAPIYTTIYGESYSVVNHPDTRSIAYQSVPLTLHQDLLYYESPPGYQFLFCKRFDDCIEGGESITVDAFYEAKRMQREYPEDFENLCRIPATFYVHHRQEGQEAYLRYRRPHIVYNKDTDKITNVNWGPFIEGPLCAPEEDVEPYFKAYRRMSQMINESETKRVFRLRPGEMWSYCNRRMLHGRNGFELNGGLRFFDGCYVNIDMARSRTQILASKFANGKPIKHSLNQSMS